MTKSPFVLLQYCIPHHLLSRCIGRLMSCRWLWLKNLLINWFIKRYQVDMSEAEKPNSSDYVDFNEFFTRALKSGVRELVHDAQRVVSPVDGCISQLGSLTGDQLLQAKGKTYSLDKLLAGKVDKNYFAGGAFITIYLSPRDYHRVHMPVTGRLIKTVYVPGRIFSVNPLTTQQVPDLFARNERMIALFETELGRVAVIMVGAMIVAGIETVWAGRVTPVVTRSVQSFNYENDNIVLKQGDELGRFFLGSTVILLFEKDQISWDEQLMADMPVRFAQPLGSRES